MITGFAVSSDTFFYQVAQRNGIDREAYGAHQLGFGNATGIDLPNEVDGIVPSNKWKQDTCGSEILPGEVLQAGIGQGYDASTPLRVLNAYAAVAKGGQSSTPTVDLEASRSDGEG